MVLDISLFQCNIKTSIHDQESMFHSISSMFLFRWWRSFDPIYSGYISQLVRFARNNVSDINESNLVKLLHQGYRFHKLLKPFTKLYDKYKDIVCMYNSTCRDLIKKGISHPCWYGDIYNKPKKCKSDTSNLQIPWKILFV